MNTNPVVHFEMPYEDAARVRKFYADVFGWGMLQMGPEMGEYVMAHTAETDAQNMVQTPGTINGGFYKKNAEGANAHVVIAVTDMSAAIEKVKAAGGEVMGEPMEIPGIGLYVIFHDSEKNRVCMLQPKGM